MTLLIQQHPGVDHQPVADDPDRVRVNDARRDQVQFEGLRPDGDGVPGVIPAVEAGDVISLCGKQIHDFAFAFVAPLRSDDDV